MAPATMVYQRGQMTVAAVAAAAAAAAAALADHMGMQTAAMELAKVSAL